MCWTGSPTGQLYKCGYKELFHRQLYQDLTGSELPEGVDIHHKDGNPANNMAKNLEPMPRSHAISQNSHGLPLFLVLREFPAQKMYHDPHTLPKVTISQPSLSRLLDLGFIL